MPKFTLLCVSIFLSIITIAQKTTITGKVTDSVSHKPIEYATITLILKDSRKIVTGTVTNKDGQFILTDIVAANYSLSVEFIGYLKFDKADLAVPKGIKDIDLGIIYLSSRAQTLQAVTVSTTKGLVENRIDKMIFNAEKDISSQGGVASDILRKVPQVSVDIDGNVELAGSSSIRFLINGKPSATFGSNIADVLQSIPASQIKSIEVITNPGAKYDAQGLGGIINIILKQSKVKGLNGNVSLSGGSRYENGSVNLNIRKGDFGFNMFASGSARLKARAMTYSNRLSNDSVAMEKFSFGQQAYNDFTRMSGEIGAGFDWTVRKTHDLSGSIHVGHFGNKGQGAVDQLQSIFEMNNGNLLSSIRTRNNTSHQYSSNDIDLNLNYKKTFAKEDQELEIALNSTFGKNRIRTTNDQNLLPVDSLYFGSRNMNPGHENESELEIDYVQPLKNDIKWGAGADLTFTEIKSQSNILGYDPLTKDYLYDSSLSYSLDYKQQVYAVYSELNFPIADLFEMKIGGRYERTQVNSFYSNAQHQAPKNGYNTFVPSIFIMKKFGETQSLKLSYSKRIERPDYEDLNPFTNISDPKNISSGNPTLRPEIGHRFELAYSQNLKKGGSFLITGFHRINLQDIQPFITFYPSIAIGDSVYTNVAISRRENIGTERNSGLNLFIDLHVNTVLTLRSNLSFFYRHIINEIDEGYNSNSFNYRFNLNASFQFTKTLVGEAFGNFNSARNEAQGKYPSFTNYTFALRKQFPDKKLSIALTAANPFAKYINQRTELFGPNFNVTSVRKIPFRSFGINLTWKFGKLEFKKESDDKVENGNTQPEG